ncbi:MAG: GH3 auxin-responsive promoter family protein [Peptococcaceae bacterium]|nr:GH3 auxin-responsive promoter family protein [Peptococcaceae bacterium]
MTLNELLKQKKYKEIWQRYCGFADLTLREYMEIQRRLMMEQIELMHSCELGQRLMQNKKPASVEDFRRLVPLTTYDDYADILLKRNISALPTEPVMWIETTWEGGITPVKLIPYSEGMIKVYRTVIIAIVLLATSKKKGSFSLRRFDRFLHCMASLPYMTGLISYVLDGEIDVTFLPDPKEVEGISFHQRNRMGLYMGMSGGIDIFCGMGSFVVKASEQFHDISSRILFGSLFQNSFIVNFKLLLALIRKKFWHQDILPKDILDLKGLIYAGTDAVHLRDHMEKCWGVKPLEVFGGAEPSCIAADVWSKDGGMVLFPDVCFYEFIPESERALCDRDPHYVPKTSLMDELVEGDTYELVFSNFKGGAFLRYRAGYVFQCLSVKNDEDGILFPQFRYVNRVSAVIDIAGFIRITEKTIQQAIDLSGLPLGDWVAVKEYNADHKPFLHLYIEMGEDSLTHMLDAETIRDQLTLYFRYVNLDEQDLEALLGSDPLVVTMLSHGVISGYESAKGCTLRKIDPPAGVISELLC